MNPNRTLVGFLSTAVIFLDFIGLAVAARPTIALLKPGTPSVRLGRHFANHATLTPAQMASVGN